MITIVCKKCNAVIVDKPYGSCLTVTEGGYCDKCFAELEAKLVARDAEIERVQSLERRIKASLGSIVKGTHHYEIEDGEYVILKGHDPKCLRAIADLEAQLAARDADKYGVYVGGVRVGEIGKTCSDCSLSVEAYYESSLNSSPDCCLGWQDEKQGWESGNPKPGHKCPRNPDKKEDKG